MLLPPVLLPRPLTGAQLQDNKSKRKQLFKQTMMDEAYDISRYQPAIKLMLEVRHLPHIRRHDLNAVIAAGTLPRQTRSKSVSLHWRSATATYYS